MKQCAKPACSQRVEDVQHVYCRQHRLEANRQYDEQRGSSNSRGYGARWRRLRKLILNRDPLCRAMVPAPNTPTELELTLPCNKPSTDVDHIVPKRDGGRDDPANLQGLCHECHSRKTALEDGRWGKG